MTQKSVKERILFNRLTYFFKNFKPSQKKFMAENMDDFLAESTQNAPRSKSLSKILDFMAQKVFKPIGRFGRVILPNTQSPQNLKRRREKMKPSLLLLHRSPEKVRRRYRGYLTTERRRSKRKTQQYQNDR